jgi:hypothetical protein
MLAYGLKVRAQPPFLFAPGKVRGVNSLRLPREGFQLVVSWAGLGLARSAWAPPSPPHRCESTSTGGIPVHPTQGRSTPSYIVLTKIYIPSHGELAELAYRATLEK